LNRDTLRERNESRMSCGVGLKYLVKMGKGKVSADALIAQAKKMMDEAKEMKDRLPEPVA